MRAIDGSDAPIARPWTVHSAMTDPAPQAGVGIVHGADRRQLSLLTASAGGCRSVAYRGIGAVA
jgi:hypothetical protein